MALEKSLVLTQNKKQKAPNNPVIARRNRLISRIKTQLTYCEQEKTGQLPQRAYRRLARWWWQEGTSYYLSMCSVSARNIAIMRRSLRLWSIVITTTQRRPSLA